MKKFISIMLALLVTAVVPLSAFAKSAAEQKLIADEATIDTDGSDGYSGDYVVIYNPNTDVYANSLFTGNMGGLIETEIGINTMPNKETVLADTPYLIDVDGRLAENAKAAGIESYICKDGDDQRDLSFEVGDTYEFSLMFYSPLPDLNIEFKVLAKGEHCYIWTPTSNDENVYPLDSIDPSFAQIAAAEFDSKFDLMQEYFGDHANYGGDGRLNILYYNIDDGWQPGQGYVGGYFSAWDLYMNDLPCLNIDTYPGVRYVTSDGTVTEDISRSYNVMVHEYQHLINYSSGGYMETWANECMSAAAEEICYPGSSINRRIKSWTNYNFENGNWQEPPEEYPYVPTLELHNGYAMYDWDSDMDMENSLVLYAQVSLFAQYLFTQYGNGIFRELLAQSAQMNDFRQAFENVTGQAASDFVKSFRIALTANTALNVLDGVYGFRMQDGYDPEDYYGVENLYSWLGPVVFT